MSDMYGALRSNEFKVKNVKAFWDWFNGYIFGDEIEMWTDHMNEDGSGTVSFGGHEQYPNAYPRIKQTIGNIEDYDDPDDADYDIVEVPDLGVFTSELKSHLDDGEVFQVIASGNEKLRYVAYSELLVSTDSDTPVWISSYTDDDVDTLRKRMDAYA